MVLDEADRMLEPGHFKQLDDIFGAIDAEMENERSTFIYSATMIDNGNLQENLVKTKKGFLLKLFTVILPYLYHRLQAK